MAQTQLLHPNHPNMLDGSLVPVYRAASEVSSASFSAGNTDWASSEPALSPLSDSPLTHSLSDVLSPHSSIFENVLYLPCKWLIGLKPGTVRP